MGVKHRRRDPYGGLIRKKDPSGWGTSWEKILFAKENLEEDPPFSWRFLRANDPRWCQYKEISFPYCCKRCPLHVYESQKLPKLLDKAHISRSRHSTQQRKFFMIFLQILLGYQRNVDNPPKPALWLYDSIRSIVWANNFWCWNEFVDHITTNDCESWEDELRSGEFLVGWVGEWGDSMRIIKLLYSLFKEGGQENCSCNTVLDFSKWSFINKVLNVPSPHFSYNRSASRSNSTERLWHYLLIFWTSTAGWRESQERSVLRKVCKYEHDHERPHRHRIRQQLCRLLCASTVIYHNNPEEVDLGLGPHSHSIFRKTTRGVFVDVRCSRHPRRKYVHH